ncbi:MAG: hypothetical protein IKO72_07965 [Kiritimatiellae bacterium]|nr:hypothetical protein [Kiritimatiellia bacterium]
MKYHAMKATALAMSAFLTLAMFAEEPKAAVASGESLLADLAVPKKTEAKPVAEAPKQVAEAPKPAAEAPKPAAEAPKPVAEAPKPVAEVPKPAAEAPKPVAEAPKPVAEAPKPVAEVPKAAATTESDTDEIDLTAADDSAVAAKGRPVVKLAPPDAKPTAEALPVAAGPVKEAVAPQGAAPATTETGTDIAARFLASDETALVDIMSDDATLTDILRQFRKATGANIIYAESTNLQQRVSVSLRHVPWLQAMSSILNSRGFRVESSGGIHFVKEDKLVDPVFTRTFQLNHASVDELARLFNESYGVKDKNGKLIHGVATPFSGANTVVVTASDRILADCEAIIKAVDKAVPQIYIEARFIELSNEAMHKLGVQWNQLESWGASVHDLNAGIEYNNGRLNKFGTGTTTTYYTPKTYNSDGKDISDGHSAVDYVTKNYLVSGEITNPSRLNTDSSTADMAWRNARVFSGQLSADDFRLAMSAFEQLEDTKIFSNPKIIVSNGKEALFDRTTKFPHITLTSQHDTQSGYTKSDAKLELIPGEDELFSKKKTAFFSWGITLTVKPRISPDGLISVEIVPSISEPDKTVTTDGFYHISGGSDAPYGSYPILLFKRLTTEFTMKDGATAVIGGLSKTEEGDVDSGIPYLRKIPWIGQKLFGWKSRGKVQKEILIFVTVGIADPANLPEDVGLPKNAVRGREYVERRALEPGDRSNASTDALRLDMRTIDERRIAKEKDGFESDEPSVNANSERGTVTITPVAPGKAD